MAFAEYDETQRPQVLVFSRLVTVLTLIYPRFFAPVRNHRGGVKFPPKDFSQFLLNALSDFDAVCCTLFSRVFCMFGRIAHDRMSIA
jgi:hypothetical protein